MTVIIVLSVILALLLSFLWIPIVLKIDTVQKQYFVQLKGLVKASLKSDPVEFFYLRLRILFWSYNYYPIREMARPSRKRIDKKAKRRFSITRWKRRRRKMFRLGRLLKTFKVKKFYVQIDTGDCITNAKLFPVFGLLNYYTDSFRVNFQDRNELVLHLQNRPIDIITSFINPKT